MQQKNPKINYSFLEILIGSDLSKRKLPFMSIASPNPGPTIWLTSCVHGDEVGGIVVIQEIFKRISTQLLKGQVCAFPLLNPIGFETASRNIALSEEDLNRAFPGDKNGSLAERMAEQIFSSILKLKPDLLLDLHNDWTSSIPYTLIDSDPGKEHETVYNQAKVFAQTTNLINILDTDKLTHSLSNSLLLRNIPALSLELGESYIVNEKNIQYGIQSIWNILKDLGMVTISKETPHYPVPTILTGKTLKYSDKPFSTKSGIVRFLVKPGEMVKKDQKVATIFNAFGKAEETIKALHDGIILAQADYSVVFPGSVLIASGIIAD